MVEKRKINVGANNGKMGKPPPEWVLNLKNGIYTVEELIKISHKSGGNIRGLMSKYAKDVKYKVLANGKSYANYAWDKDHFLDLFYGDKGGNKQEEININPEIKTKLEIAKKMKSAKVSLSDILNFTGLTKEQIEKL